MTKELKICLILLVTLSAINAQRSPNRTSAAGRTRKGPRGFQEWEDPLATFCEDNNVPTDTWYVYPEWCNWYIVCWDYNDGNGVVTEFYECDEENSDVWFIQDTRGAMGECLLRGVDDVCRTQTPTWPICPAYWDPPEVVFHPSEDCNSFYVCSAGFPILTQCHPRLHWDPIRQRCDEPSRAGCESTLPPDLPDCPADIASVNLPHPTSCELFIACRNGNRIIQRCLHLHYFDIFQSMCLPVTQAVCILDFSGGPRG